VKIKAGAERGKRFVPKTNRSGSSTRRSDCGNSIVDLSLANARLDKSAVALYANLAARKKVRHCSDSFLGALRAGTHRQDEITERKFRAWFENKGVLLHHLPHFDSNSGAIVQFGQGLDGRRRGVDELLATSQTES
jgi:hypothetical protein